MLNFESIIIIILYEIGRFQRRKRERNTPNKFNMQWNNGWKNRRETHIENEYEYAMHLYGKL